MHIEREQKVWGYVRHLFDTPGCAVSVLEVEKGGYSSRHFHEFRINRFMVISGEIEVREYRLGGESINILGPGLVWDVAPRVEHRFVVRESGIVIEVYYPPSISLGDIKRFDVGGME